MTKILLFSFGLVIYILPAGAQQSGVTRGHMPGGLRLTENKGQWNEKILYRAQVPNGNVLLEKNDFYFFLYSAQDLAQIHHPGGANVTVHGHAFKEEFEGANANAALTGENAFPDYANYYIGNDPAHWASTVKIYPQVRYQNLYDGIDLLIYSRKNEQVKYDLLLKPGADASAIKIKYTGVDHLKLEGGSLVIKTSVGDLVEEKPYCYQEINGVRKEVVAEFVLSGHHLSFNFPQGYDHTLPLVIDPSIVFSTYTGATTDNWGYTCTYDNQGNMFLGGYVNATPPQFGSNYPTTAGAFQTAWHGGTGGASSGTGSGIGYACDMGITKFTPDGTALIYSTYLGGSDNETPNSLVVDAQDNLVVYGVSYSTDYPVTTGAFQSTNKGLGDIVVTKLNAGGTALLGSTYIGGSRNDGINFDPAEFSSGNLKRNYGDQNRGEVNVDNNGNIYVVSSTRSSDFPVSTGAFQPATAGLQDACVFKLSADCSQLIYSSYLGGTKDDAGYSCDLAANGTLFVAGGTMSTNFPTTGGVINGSYQGGAFDGFVANISADGRQLLSSTYIGTAGNDQVYCLKLDLNGDVYFMGQTTGQYPVLNALYSNPNSGQFIVKTNPALTTVYYSTVFGNGSGAPNISPTAFLVDTCENVYVAGWGDGAGSVFASYNRVFMNDMSNMPLTPDALQATSDGTDFYFFVMSRDAQSLIYASYFGGNGQDEHVDGGTSRFDKRGIIYEAICAGCGGTSLTPTTAGVWSTTNQSSNCNELGLKIAFNQTIPHVSVQAYPRATGCVPLTVQFSSVTSNAIRFTWNFGDNSSGSALSNPVHTYLDTGIYIVTLIGVNGCNLSDTAYTTVVVRNDSLSANFLPHVHVNCDSQEVSLSANAFSTTQYLWTMGDGSTYTTPSVTHVYAAPNSYNITLVLIDSTKCNLRDTFTAPVRIPPYVRANFTTSGSRGCIPYAVNFSTQQSPTATYYWTLGDSTTAGTAGFSHTYTTADTFAVRLIVVDSTSCNIADTAYTSIITIDSFAHADFHFNRTFYHCDSVLITAWTDYTGENSELWDFGDGTRVSNVDSVSHMYNVAGTFIITHYISDSRMVCQPNDTARIAVSLLPLQITIGTPSAGGCLPFTSNFIGNSALLSTNYYWFFGDGDSTTGNIASHVYRNTGIYRVRVVAVDTNACVGVDSLFATVTVINDSVHAAFQLNVLHDCDSMLVVNLVNQSTNALQYQWTLGDGSTSALQNVNYTYHLPGTYTIKLVAIDTNRCHPIDSLTKTVTMLPNAMVNFTADSACFGTAIQFINYSNPAARFTWYFGDNHISTEFSPLYNYTVAGSYDVHLVIIDSATCNVNDTASHIVEVYRTPIAGMLLVTDTFKFEHPVQFTDNSIYYTHLEWSFGDGATSDETNPVHTYERIDSMRVCIVASNPTCADTTCEYIFIKFIPLIGVPNAFSPNGDGINDVVKVEGQGIVEITFRIFNRWGEKVFETHDVNQGWDGVYKGELQEMDVFTYTVQATLINGQPVALKGNITLLR